MKIYIDPLVQDGFLVEFSDRGDFALTKDSIKRCTIFSDKGIKVEEAKCVPVWVVECIREIDDHFFSLEMGVEVPSDSPRASWGR